MAALEADFTDRFNTQLTPDEEAEFQQWAKDHGKDRDTYDYDLRGAWKAKVVGEDGKHSPDTYKKPNHPTFSDESVYSGKEGYQGGKWSKQKNGSYEYRPSKTNLEMRSPEELARYFKSREPGVKLVLPEEGDMGMVRLPDGRVVDEESFKLTPQQINSGQGVGVLSPNTIAQARKADPVAAAADQISGPVLADAAKAQPPAAKPTAANPAAASPEDQHDPRARAMTQKSIEDSTDAVRKASPRVAKSVSQQLKEMGVDIGKAYDEMIGKLGGFKTPDLKMSESDKGLFLMDFGLRLMANSNGYWTENVGKAGMGTLADYREEMKNRTDSADKYNEELRKTAGTLAGDQVKNQMGALADTQIVGDAEGNAVEYNPSVGVLGPAENPETGSPLNPTGAGRKGSTAAAGKTPRPLDVQVKYQMLIDQAGYTPAQAAEAAISGLTNDKKWMEGMKYYLESSQFLAEFDVDGKKVPKEKMTDDDINKWIQKNYIDQLGRMNENGKGPALGPKAAPQAGSGLSDEAYDAAIKAAGLDE